MGNTTTVLLILVFAVMGLTFLVLLMALIRETLFWYWRSKGVTQIPRDVLHKGHETAILIKKNIEGLKAAEKSASIRPKPSGVTDAA
jgi:hypothetical protein